MVPTDLLRRVDELIELGEKALATRFQYEREDTWYVRAGERYAFSAAVLSFLDRHFGSGHPYYAGFNRAMGNHTIVGVESGITVVKAMRDEMAGGWMTSVKSLVSAEIFADFLEMAEHLLSQDYKDAAAVMIGGVLEEHLRQLCVKRGVDLSSYDAKGKMVPKMGGTLNDDLMKDAAYNKLDHKLVTAWLDLRNKAAHAKYFEYEKAQVELMCQGVTDFVARNPA